MKKKKRKNGGFIKNLKQSNNYKEKYLQNRMVKQKQDRQTIEEIEEKKLRGKLNSRK